MRRRFRESFERLSRRGGATAMAPPPPPTPWEYSPLLNDEIRLLRILKNAPDEPIELSIANYPLSTSPRYDALSYLWGPPSESTTALLNGIPLPIRTNLAAFLRQAVPTTTPPDFTPPPQTALLPGAEVDLLWIDALCINQADTAERNAQVQRMGAVYARADRVLAWLGAHDHDSALAMDAMRNLSLSALRDDDAHLAAEVASQMADWECLRGIVNLVQREYWRRAWYVSLGFPSLPP
jgi:hypothetical protein